MLLRPRRVASYALVLWTVIRPLGLVVNIRLTEENAIQAVPTIGLDDTSGIPSVENSDLNITVLEIAPVTDNNVKDNTDKAREITQLSEVCFYKDKPPPPSWITDDPLGNICISPTLTNVTITAVSAPPTFPPSIPPPQTNQLQLSSVLSIITRLFTHLELDFGTQSDCVCKGNSGTDPHRMLLQMALKLLLSSLIQRLYLYVLKYLRHALVVRWRSFGCLVGKPKAIIEDNVPDISSSNSDAPPHRYHHTVYGYCAILFWRRKLIMGVTRNACAPTLVANPKDETDEQSKTNGFNQLDQISSEPHSEESTMTQAPADMEEFEQPDSEATESDKSMDINDRERVNGDLKASETIDCSQGSLSDNSISQDLGVATTETYENTDFRMNGDTTARPASHCALLGDDLSFDFDTRSINRSGSVDAWFEMNMSKEIPSIKVQLFEDDSETGNCLSADNTDEHKSNEQPMTDPMEFKPIGYRYPRSEDARHTDIIESFNSKEARSYVAERCPFLFEDLETPPLTPTLPDMEGSSSDDGDGQWETECTDLTAIKVGSGHQISAIHDIPTMDSNSSKSIGEVAAQLAPAAVAPNDLNERGETSSTSPLGGATSIIRDLANSAPLEMIPVQSGANVAIPTDCNENGHNSTIAGSDSIQNTPSKIVREVLDTAREPDIVTIQGAMCQDSSLAFPKINDLMEESISTNISPRATPPSNPKRNRKSSDQDSRIKSIENAVSISLVQPVDIWLPSYLEPELASIDVLFEAKGSTGNWKRREGLIMHLRGMLKGYTFRTFSKELASGLAKNRRLEKTLNALSSSRQTTVCLAASYYSELAQYIGTDFDPFVKIVLPPLLRLSGSSHQALVNCTQMALQVIIVHGIRNSRSALSILLRDYTNETNPQIRQHTIKHLMTMLRAYGSGTSLKTLRVSSSDVVAVALKAALTDADIEVRKTARLCYWEFAEIWSKVALDIRNKMSKRAKELLDKSKLERSISDPGSKCVIEYPNVVVTEVDGEEVEPCRAQVWNGNKSYPPEAFSGVAPLIDPRYLSPFPV